VPCSHSRFRSARPLLSSDHCPAIAGARIDITITFDEATQTLDLSATIVSELLLSDLNDGDHTEARSRVSDIAGAGLIRDPATEIRAGAIWDLTGKDWLYERFW
jgi:hypothetical protein